MGETRPSTGKDCSHGISTEKKWNMKEPSKETNTHHCKQMLWIQEQINKATSPKLFEKLMKIRDNWRNDYVALCNRLNRQ